MVYRIPHYVRDVKRRLGALSTLDGMSRLVIVIGAIGVVVLGVLIVEALFRLLVLVIVLAAIGLGVRLWWLPRAMPTAGPRKGAVGRTIESEYRVIKKQATRRKRKPGKGRKRVN